MRILHQVNNLAIGGVETFVWRLAKYANETTIVYSHKDGVVREWIEKEGIKVYLQENKDIFELIEKFKIDVLVMHTGSTLPDYALKLKLKFPKLKFITVLHTHYSADEWVDKIVCIAKSIYDVNDPKKRALIYPGIERNEKFIIGEVTRLAPYKHLEDLIAIAGMLSTKCDNFVFRIIGEEAVDAPGYLNTLKEKIGKLKLEKYFEFLGFVDKVDYHQFDAFIHLVGNESYPVTILEALNAKLPTHSYLRVGTEEIKGYGPLILHGSINSIIDSLEHHINNRFKHIKECANEFTEIYGELVK